jgi:hypothetical protein
MWLFSVLAFGSCVSCDVTCEPLVEWQIKLASQLFSGTFMTLLLVALLAACEKLVKSSPSK